MSGMSGSALTVWDLPFTVRVNFWIMAFSSLNKIKGRPLTAGRPSKARLSSTLAGQRLVPQTALGNARAGKIDVKIAGTRPEQRARETQGGTSQCAVPSHGESLLAQSLSPHSVPF